MFTCPFSFNSSIGLTAVLTRVRRSLAILMLMFQFLNRTNRCSDAKLFSVNRSRQYCFNSSIGLTAVLTKRSMMHLKVKHYSGTCRREGGDKATRKPKQASKQLLEMG